MKKLLLSAVLATAALAFASAPADAAKKGSAQGAKKASYGSCADAVRATKAYRGMAFVEAVRRCRKGGPGAI